MLIEKRAQKIFAHILVAAMALTLAACRSSMPANNSPTPIESQSPPPVQREPDYSAQSQSLPPIQQEADHSAQEPQHTPNSHELVWKVEPTLEHEAIAYCFSCGFFSKPDSVILDEITGEALGFKDAHGQPILKLFYDPTLSLFGAYAGMTIPVFNTFSEDEFLSEFPYLADKFNLFHGIDSTKVVTSGGGADSPPKFDFGDALNGMTALAIGTDIASWHEFDDDEYQTTIERGLGIVAVRSGELWGILDNNGNMAAPFMFEHAIAIDNYTAFAKHDGLYGILQVKEANADALLG